MKQLTESEKKKILALNQKRIDAAKYHPEGQEMLDDLMAGINACLSTSEILQKRIASHALHQSLATNRQLTLQDILFGF